MNLGCTWHNSSKLDSALVCSRFRGQIVIVIVMVIVKTSCLCVPLNIPALEPPLIKELKTFFNQLRSSA